MKRSSLAHDFRRDGDLVGRLLVEYQGTTNIAQLYSFTLRDGNGDVLQRSQIPIMEVVPRKEDERYATVQRPTKLDIRSAAAMILDVIREEGEGERPMDSATQQAVWELDDFNRLAPQDEPPDIELNDATRAWAETNHDLLLEAEQMILDGARFER